MPPRRLLHDDGLTKSERFLLGWIAERGGCEFGEARGEALTGVLNADLAKVVRFSTDPDHSRVELTDAGKIFVFGEIA